MYHGERSWPRVFWMDVLAVVALAISSVGLLHRHPSDVLNLEVTPDEFEYALAAHRWVETGRYEILVDGKGLPPRYPPWFSLFIVAPAYLLFTPEPGNAIYSVTTLGVVGIMAAFFIGRRIANHWGGVLASVAVMALPLFRYWGRLVMTDVPAAAIVLLTCLTYMAMRANPTKATLGLDLGAGFLIAIAAAFRPSNMTFLLPFLAAATVPSRPARVVGRWFCLAMPAATIGCLTLWYNQTAFGSPWRTGYQFWCAVPYDYGRLLFSADYIPRNLRVLGSQAAPIAAAVAGAILVARVRRRTAAMESTANTNLRALLEFLAMGAMPLTLFYLAYFYPDDRFYLPAMVLIMTFAGATLGLWLRHVRSSILALALVLMPVGVFGQRAGKPPDAPPVIRVTIDEMQRRLPPDAVILSALPPAYIEYFVCRHSQRRAIPISRRVEYASKLLAREKIVDPMPPPKNWRDHRCPGLVNGGAEEAVALVVAERFQELHAMTQSGQPVFLATVYLADDDLDVLNRIAAEFEVRQVAQFLYQLHPKARSDSWTNGHTR